MMEFTVDDFPTPPFPITIIVKEFTFYTKTNTRNSQSRKKKKKTSLQMQILAKKKKDNSKTKLLSMKNCSRECNNLRGNKKKYLLFKFSQKLKQLSLCSRCECIDSRPLTDNLGCHWQDVPLTQKREEEKLIKWNRVLAHNTPPKPTN